MLLTLSLRQWLFDFYWTQYLLTLLTSCFPHLPHVQLPRHHSSPSSFSHSLSCTFCYLICLPRTSDFANTQLVRLPTLGSMIAWAYLPHHNRKWALPLSLHVHKKPSCAHWPQESHTPKSPRVFLNKGSDIQLSSMCISHLDKPIKFLFVCLESISPAPKNW